MNRIVVGFSYVIYNDVRRRLTQENAITVLSRHSEGVYPISLGFYDEKKYDFLKEVNIPQLNILKRDSAKIINNNRRLPYIKEILECCYKVDCETFGYINSDILVSPVVYDILRMDFDAYMFSRSDIAEVSVEDFESKNIKIIYGGNQHSGVDGFFFKKSWWDISRKKFHDDLVVGDSEWDTYYRKTIKKLDCRYLEARALFHVYHNAKWDVNSPGAQNNIRILNNICQ